MYPFDKENIFRKISINLFVPLLFRSKLSANQITVLNFLTLGLGSVILFILGSEYLGLLAAGLMAMVDYCDGTIARERNEASKLGQYLDTSLDWIYLMLLIGAISYHYKIIPVGYLALIALTFGNWIEYNAYVKYSLPKFLRITPLLVIGILIKHLNWSIYLITLTQCYKTGRMYLWSIFKNWQ